MTEHCHGMNVTSDIRGGLATLLVTSTVVTAITQNLTEIMENICLLVSSASVPRTLFQPHATQ